MNFDLKFYWGLLLRRLPVMLALFLICTISASVTALKLPPTFSTTATLLVEQAQIPDSMMGMADSTDVGQQLQVIEQRLMTRANLLDIARQFDTFEDIRTMSPDEIVDGMRNQTRISRSGGRGQANLMNISFEARTGQIAANVVNEYVTLVLEESTEFRMSRAEGTLTFFEQEVRRLSEDLDLQSAQIVQFKNNNASALPSDLGYRQNRQSLLQERQARQERDIATLLKQRESMVMIFEETGRIDAPGAVERTPLEQQLDELKLGLEQALAVYSENNPRVTLLRNRVAQLEIKVKEEAATRVENSAADNGPATLFELTLAQMDQRLAAEREELAITNAELDSLNESIQATAGNAISLAALERDFENIQARYNDAVRNLNQARVNERVEVSAQGQRVTVIENANVPQDPSGPNRFKLIAMGIAAGGGLAGGFFVLLELLNRTIRRPAELQAKFGIIPLTVVPYMESRRERLIRRGALIAALVAVLISVPAALWYIDTQYMPLDVLASKVFSRLGLT